MATDADRVARFLAYADKHAEEIAGVPAIEVALVRRCAGEQDALRDVLPETLGDFPLDKDAPQHKWIVVQMEGGALPALELPHERDGGHALTHAVYWASDFGHSPLSSSGAVERLTGLLPDAPDWEHTGQYLLALECLGAELPAARLSAYCEWYDAPWRGGWANYHPRLVGALLFALRG